MPRSHVLAIMIVLCGCHGRDLQLGGSDRIVMTSKDDREANVGKRITIEGEVSRTKLPQIAGVDIDVDEAADPRGKVARATGILRKTVVTKEELDRAIAEHGQFANRGPGTFYHLESSDGQGLARATVIR